MSKNTQNNEISAVDFTANIRPVKIAFLIDANLTLKWILDEVIPWISTVWGGGATYFFLPVTKDFKNDPQIETWVKLLQKLDPDRIVSTGAFPDSFLDFIASNLLTQAKPFQYNPKTVTTPRMIPRGHQYTIPTEDLISTQQQPIRLTEIALTGSLMHDLWFFSLYGRCGTYLQAVQSSSKVVQGNSTIQIADIERHCKDICSYRYPSNFDGSPLLASLKFLGQAGANEYFDHYASPHILIIGETPADWCLFQSLNNFYPGVRWIPQSFLSNASTTGGPNRFDDHLHDILSNLSKTNETIVTSTSIDATSLQQIVSSSLSAIQNLLKNSTQPAFQVELDFNAIIHNWIDWGESENFRESSMIFQGPLSIQKAPFLAPKNFLLPPEKSKFFVTLSTNTYKFLGHHMTDSVPIQWQQKSASLKDDARRTYTGGIAFYPIGHVTLSGQGLDSALHGPRIVKQTLLNDFGTILSKRNLDPVKTIGSMNIDSVLDLWDNSLEEFCRDYYDADSSKIFNAFRLGNKAQKSTQLGLISAAGICIKRQFFFSFPLGAAFSTPLATVSDEVVNRWIERQVLIRGERLTCLTCGWIDFYSELEVNRSFKCKRCGNTHIRSLKTMKQLEPKFIYGMTPLLYGLQESNSDLVIFGIKKIKEMANNYFDFESEIELQNSARKSVQEIDIVGNLDGRLVIGECKSNGQLNGQQLKNYVTFCSNFNVHKFICVLSGGWSSGARSNIENAFKALKYLEVIFI